MTEKIQLNGGPEKSVTWIWLGNGQLMVECYDCSEPAQKLWLEEHEIDFNIEKESWAER